MNVKQSLKFKIVEDSFDATKYTNTCSGSRSDCCTRVCTRLDAESDDGSLQSWDDYLDVNAGVLQY